MRQFLKAAAPVVLRAKALSSPQHHLVARAPRAAAAFGSRLFCAPVGKESSMGAAVQGEEGSKADEAHVAPQSDQAQKGEQTPGVQAPHALEKRMEVPKDSAKALIGRGGDMRKQLMEKSGTFLFIEPRQADKDMRGVVIRGTEEQIAKCYELIQTELSNFDKRAAKRTSMGKATDESEMIEVDSAKVAFLIGKGGTTVRSIMEESTARIYFDNKQSKDPMTKVKIHGNSEAIAKAKGLIEEQISAFDQRESNKPEQPKEEVLEYKQNQISIIIGKGGANIKQVQADSRANIRISDPPQKGSASEPQSDVRKVAIRGTPAAIESAKAKIEALLAGVAESSSRPPAEDTVQETFSVKDSEVAQVIGRKGAKIQQISRETGAMVFIDARKPEGEDGDGMRSVSVRGTPDAIARARDMIDEVLSAAQRGGDQSYGSRQGGERRGDRPRRRRLFDREEKVEHDGLMEGSFLVETHEEVANTLVDETALVDVASVVEELKAENVEVDKETAANLKAFAEILSFNPGWTLAQKKEFLKAHAVGNAQEIPEELKKVVEY